VESVGDVHVAQIGLDGRVRGRQFQVDHDAVYEGDGSVDETVVPDLGLAHLHGDGGDLVDYKGGFNRARLAGVDLEGVWLEELCEALDIGETEIGVAP
jgi:hypothetical protein